LIEKWALSDPELPALIFAGEKITYSQLNREVNRVANGLTALGIKKGDRVAIMLPNIPEFVYSFFAILRIGAVAVPFNTLYKGGEILHILEDSGSKALISLTNFAPMINELIPELPELEHVILTGERNLIFAHPESTVFIQLILQKNQMEDLDHAYGRIGNLMLDIVRSLGVDDPWYKHRGSIRVRGDKIAAFVISEIEDMYLINVIVFLTPLDINDFLRVVWVPHEIRDKMLEPLTSVQEEAGERPSWDRIKECVTRRVEKEFGVEITDGNLVRDELFGYEKLRSLAYKDR